MKSNANPLILGLNGGCNLDEIKVKGKKLAEVSKGPNGEELDSKIEIKYYKTKEGKQREQILEEFRLVAFYKEEDEKYHVYITSISDELLTANDIAQLYKGRWEIELEFKELKSKFQLDIIKTTNEQAIEAFIWLSILAMIVSRELYNIIKKLNIESCPDFLRDILCYLGAKDIITNKLEIYESKALDPHANRERFRDNLWA